MLWLRHNLFSTPVSGFLSIVAIAASVLAYKGLLTFIMDPARRWDAVTFNLKLLMVFAYPADELWRMWLTVGTVVVLLAASFAVWKDRRHGRTAHGWKGAYGSWCDLCARRHPRPVVEESADRMDRPWTCTDGRGTPSAAS